MTTPTCPFRIHFCMHDHQRMSVIQNSEVVRYSGSGNVLALWGISIGALGDVRYMEVARY